MNDAKKKSSPLAEPPKKSHGAKRHGAAAMLESVFACKWSARLLALLRAGPQRPGAIVRSLDGLTTKVFNDCGRRLLSFGLVERVDYAEVPPRVEYRLTPRGERFVVIIDAVEELQRDLVAHEVPPTVTPRRARPRH
jgi:DNA-binding HxlR family transcriptional regulator